MTEWIGETFTSETGWKHLEQLVDLGNRMAGTEGEREGAELTRDALEAAGARDARLEPFDIQGWERVDSAIEADETTQESIALPRSPEGEVTAELVDVGYGLPEDFEDADLEGKVVMADTFVPDWFERYIHRTEKYYRAVQAGAAAFVYRNHVEGGLPPTGSVGRDEQPIGEIPAVGVSTEVGSRLARRFDGESVTVTVDADIYEAESYNVHAALGPETDEQVLVTSHVDAHDIAEGAMDNGAGTAMVVQVAEALAAREDELDTRVHFVAYGAEEVGLCGSEHHAEETDFETVKAVVNNDGVVRGRTLSFACHGFDTLAAAAEAVGERFDHPVRTNPQQGPHSDHWPFVRWGVPGYHVMSETGSDGRGWGHTEADTIDKLESRDLREQAVLLSELVVDIADDGTEIDHKDAEEIAAALEAEDHDAAMKLMDEWPYDD
ncbi:MAG: M28 family peptidase [Halobacteriales archaeon]